MATGFCRLCLSLSNLRNSHVVPNAYFKHLKRSDNGKAITFDASPSGVATQTSESWHEQLLCGTCELKLGRWETACIDVLRRIARQKEPAEAAIRKFDYQAFRFFGLSILWRAAASSQPAFSNIALPPDVEEQYRTVLDEAADPERAKFAFRIRRLVDASDMLQMEALILTPYADGAGPTRRFSFVFGGFLLDFFVPKAPSKYQGASGFLADRATLYIPDVRFQNVPRLMDALVAGYGKPLAGR